MNLYAIVSSERASKGQGGKYLDIKITGENKQNYARLFIQQDGEIELTNARGVMVYRANAVEFSETKGEKQKGEFEWCYDEHTRGKYGGITGKHIHD